MKKYKKSSLQNKLAIAFAIVIIGIMVISLILHIQTVGVIRQVTYDKMKAQAEYYQETFETEIHNALGSQMEFFSDRKLPFLASPVAGLEGYEKRDAVLTVQERLRTVVGTTSLVDRGIVYIPGNDYCITAGTITRMTPELTEEMNRYLEPRDLRLQYDGENFYYVRTGETGTVMKKNPNCVFVLIFSSEQVKKNLSMLNTSLNSGAFIYNEKENVILESSSANDVGKLIWQNLKKDENENYLNVQRIKVNQENYLVFVGGTGEMGTFVQYVEEASTMEYLNRSWSYMLIALFIMVLMSIIFILYTRRIVHKPLNILKNAFENVKNGNLEEHIFHGRKDEFSYIYQAFNDMEDHLKRLIDETYVQKNLIQKAQMKQLQAQINPHFLYNSFFTLSRRIKRQDYENAEEFAKHLGNYFKYLTRDGADYIPLKQEVEHGKSYAAIQQARFSNRIRIIFGELPEEYEGLLVPRLILQPLLENSFGHGLENKVSDGVLKVGFINQTNGLRIVVEDNGEEATDEDIQKMKESLNESGEVTGIVNIHKRLMIYFNGTSGLTIERSELGGVAISINIQVTDKDEELLQKSLQE